MSTLSFLETLPDRLHLPTVIAACASLGIHAVLGLSLPTLSADSKPEEPLRGSVRVVELTPAEQRRLPQSSRVPLTTSVPQPSIPLPPPLPTKPYTGSPVLRLPPLNPPSDENNFPREIPGGESKLPSRIKKYSRVVEFPSPQPPNPKPHTPEDNNRTQQSQASGNPTAPPANEDPTATPRPKPENPNSADKTQQTRLEEQRQQALVAELQQRQRDLIRDETDTSDRDAQRNYVAWSVKQNIAQKPEEITITGSYPQDACIKKLEGTPVVGVSVDASNNISDSKLIKSSGYPIFNKKALEDAVNIGNFNNKTGKPKTYLVYVKYQYNRKICPGLTLPESPGNS